MAALAMLLKNWQDVSIKRRWCNGVVPRCEIPGREARAGREKHHGDALKSQLKSTDPEHCSA